MKTKALPKFLVIMGFLVFGLISYSSHAHANNAHAELQSPSLKKLVAHVQFTETDKGIKVTADVSGLKPGSVHGFHVHEKNECKGPDFKSAGGHLNPAHTPHSGPAASMNHLGDLGNLVANAKGVARTEVLIPTDEAKDMNVFLGKAIIIHEKADDLATQPTGDSGDRLACGIIKAEK